VAYFAVALYLAIKIGNGGKKYNNKIMLCNYCLEKIPQGEEVRELAAGDAIIKSVIEK